tara:strand:- start:1201 stop:3072 length:1872 start_codon:yes stop_codon:yes gene_type:complete
MFDKKYDVIVVGGGHAGCEAAAASANLGSKTLLVTMNLQTLGQMSCNPAMGGIAKGQIIREIDALGGYSGFVSDFSAIQFKMLNKSKGPAMWSPRAQSDRAMFSQHWRCLLEKTKNLDFYQDMVTSLIVSSASVKGVKTALGVSIFSNSVILTNGTFLNGLIHVGEKNFGGGRAGEKSSQGLTSNLESYGFISGRMKTGTPPRVDGRTLDYSLMEEQPGDASPGRFSFIERTKRLTIQKSCYITYTSGEVHDELRLGFDKSPMFNGRIKSVGPRYCPSIEDKIHKFSEKPRHQIFVEPEGWNTIEVYVNGFSTSLPQEVQFSALKKVKGFENVKFFRPGYAIEYDYFPPTQLSNTLETKIIQNLFFAGQINGTTGYEEAAAQGLIAGINANMKINGFAPFVLQRDEAYIGVLIDDLVLKGTEEPYRMFTSRAEYRMLLRQDNADQRLTPKAFKIGIIDEERVRLLDIKTNATDKMISFLRQTSFNATKMNEILSKKQSSPVKQSGKLDKILSRPNITLSDLNSIEEVSGFINKEKIGEKSIEQAEIQIKYSGYINKEKEIANKIKRLESVLIPNNFNYTALSSLSSEAKEKLTEIKPNTISQASRISGINPSDISVLLVSLGR